MLTNRLEIIARFDRYCSELAALPPQAIDGAVRSALMVTIILEDIYGNPDADPAPVLEACLTRQFAGIADIKLLLPHLASSASNAAPISAEIDPEELFENAWATFSDATYGNSVALIDQRLECSGLDAQFFRGKRCFDGGCGIGRFSIAMAKLGAAKVIAIDVGQKSLDYTANQAKRAGLTNIETIRQDVTDLSRWPDASFDFVVSYGVLHHTIDPMKGLREHFRVLRPGGLLWLYLYGDGGLYWAIYDRLRSVISQYPVEHVKRTLQRMGLREGLVYTFLDNVLAPRTYHYETDIVRALRENDPDLIYRRASGSSVVDDVDLSLKTRFGKEIIGPQGEVRLIVTKGGASLP
jgi:ubiquinone/menaquinone biosynthesis C-methylase UbiE